MYCFVVCDVGGVEEVYMWIFSGGLCLLCWIVVVVVDVGPCTCMYQVLLLHVSCRAQATLHCYQVLFIKLVCTGDAAPIVM